MWGGLAADLRWWWFWRQLIRASRSVSGGIGHPKVCRLKLMLEARSVGFCLCFKSTRLGHHPLAGFEWCDLAEGLEQSVNIRSEPSSLELCRILRLLREKPFLLPCETTCRSFPWRCRQKLRFHPWEMVALWLWTFKHQEQTFWNQLCHCSVSITDLHQWVTNHSSTIRNQTLSENGVWDYGCAKAVLERVGSVTEPRSFAVPDWRRRQDVKGSCPVAWCFPRRIGWFYPSPTCQNLVFFMGRFSTFYIWRHQPTQLDAPTLGPGAKFGTPSREELCFWSVANHQAVNHDMSYQV